MFGKTTVARLTVLDEPWRYRSLIAGSAVAWIDILPSQDAATAGRSCPLDSAAPSALGPGWFCGAGVARRTRNATVRLFRFRRVVFLRRRAADAAVRTRGRCRAGVTGRTRDLAVGLRVLRMRTVECRGLFFRAFLFECLGPAAPVYPGEPGTSLLTRFPGGGLSAAPRSRRS
jgi:hypothetical protein